MPTIIAGGTPQTINLPEGQALTVSGAAGTVGMLYRLDQALGGTNSLQSWRIGAGALPVIGPFAGQQRFLVTCTTGAVTATIADGVLAPARPAVQLSPLARTRVAGQVGETAPGTVFTVHTTRQAPAHFDAVQIIINGKTSSASNAFKASIAVSARYNDGYRPLTAAGAAAPFMPVTWGSTNPADFRSTGGAPSATIQNASGSTAGVDLIEGATASDWMPVASLDRTDFPDRPPLVMVRLSGDSIPATSSPNAIVGAANPFTSVLPEFYTGYWSNNDYTASTPAGNTINQNLWANIDIVFLLRGKVIRSVAVAGDSLEQGYVAPTAVPQFGGNINGWGRRLVAKLNATGALASYTDLTQGGQTSFVFHNRAYTALLNGGLTHLFVKPWSTNEAGDGMAGVPAALRRTSQLIALATAKGVKIVLIRPWAGQSVGTAMEIAVQAYCDQAAAAGVAVMDARQVAGDPALPGTNNMNPAYLSKTGAGATVDIVHLNDAGQEAVSAYAFDSRAQFGL